MTHRSPRSVTSPSSSTAWRERVLWLLPAVLAALLYLPSIQGGKVWDDQIVLDTQMEAFHGLGDAFFPPDHVPQWPYSYYRPALTASYLVDLALFGAGATRGPHGTVVLLHVLCTLFATWLGAQLFRGYRFRRWGAVAAGALFAAHPIHTETVSWITGRSDALAAAFLLPALGTAVLYRDRRRAWAICVSAVLFLFALFSKEASLAGLGLLPLWLAWVPGAAGESALGSKRATESKRAMESKSTAPRSGLQQALGAWPLLVAYGASLLVYLFLRAAAGTRSPVSSLSAEALGDVVTRSFAALAYYLTKLLVPAPQSLLVLDLPGLGLTLVVLVIGLVAAIWAVGLARGGETVWLVSGAWVGITLLPSLPIAWTNLAEAPVAERYLYLPSVGLCLIFGALVVRGLAPRSRRLPTVVAAIALVVVASVATMLRERVWASDIALWSDTVEKAPSSGLAWGELGKAYLDRQSDLEKALGYYQRAIEADNDAEGRAIAYNSIGVIHARRDRLDEALDAWRAAVREKPDYASAHYNIANLLANRYQTKAREHQLLDRSLLLEARSHLEQAVAADPRYRKAWLRLLWCDVQEVLYLLNAGDRGGAEASLSKAEEARQALHRLDPEDAMMRQADGLLQRARMALGAS